MDYSAFPANMPGAAAGLGTLNDARPPASLGELRGALSRLESIRSELNGFLGRWRPGPEQMLSGSIDDSAKCAEPPTANYSRDLQRLDDVIGQLTKLAARISDIG